MGGHGVLLSQCSTVGRTVTVTPTHLASANVPGDFEVENHRRLVKLLMIVWTSWCCPLAPPSTLLHIFLRFTFFVEYVFFRHPLSVYYDLVTITVYLFFASQFFVLSVCVYCKFTSITRYLVLCAVADLMCQWVGVVNHWPRLIISVASNAFHVYLQDRRNLKQNYFFYWDDVDPEVAPSNCSCRTQLVD